MDLSVILVNYKSAKLTIDCVNSIYNQKSTINYEVIIVDNGSNDGSISEIKKNFPNIKILRMDYNSGFARANNQAIQHSQGEVVLLLNTDTIIENNAIERAFKMLQESVYIACGVQLLNSDKSPQISGNYFMPGGLNNLLPTPYLGNVLKLFAKLIRVKKPNVPSASSTIEVDWINGAFLMVKRVAIENVGLLDEDFFLYAEEAEWCSRMRKFGKLAIFGEINVVHFQGETANETFGSKNKGYQNLTDKKGGQIMLSNFVRIRKQFGILWFLTHLIFYSIAIPIYYIGVLVENLFQLKKISKGMKYAIGYSSNVMTIWKSAAKIISNKPHFYKVL